MRAIKIFVDGKYWVDIRFGNPESRTVPVGTHVIKVTNTLYTRRVEFEIQAGETARFTVGNLLPGMLGSMMVILGFVPYGLFLERLKDDAP